MSLSAKMNCINIHLTIKRICIIYIMLHLYCYEKSSRDRIKIDLRNKWLPLPLLVILLNALNMISSIHHFTIIFIFTTNYIKLKVISFIVFSASIKSKNTRAFEEHNNPKLASTCLRFWKDRHIWPCNLSLQVLLIVDKAIMFIITKKIGLEIT